MAGRSRGVRHGRAASGIVACYLLMLFIVPLVHDDVACARSATHCLACAASAMAAAPAGRVSTVAGAHLAVSGFVRPYGHLLSDTVLPFRRTGRSPPDLPLEQL